MDLRSGRKGPLLPAMEPAREGATAGTRQAKEPGSRAHGAISSNEEVTHLFQDTHIRGETIIWGALQE